MEILKNFNIGKEQEIEMSLFFKQEILFSRING